MSQGKRFIETNGEERGESPKLRVIEKKRNKETSSIILRKLNR